MFIYFREQKLSVCATLSPTSADNSDDSADCGRVLIVTQGILVLLKFEDWRSEILRRLSWDTTCPHKAKDITHHRLPGGEKRRNRKNARQSSLRDRQKVGVGVSGGASSNQTRLIWNCFGIYSKHWLHGDTSERQGGAPVASPGRVDIYRWCSVELSKPGCITFFRLFWADECVLYANTRMRPHSLSIGSAGELSCLIFSQVPKLPQST